MALDFIGIPNDLFSISGDDPISGYNSTLRGGRTLEAYLMFHKKRCFVREASLLVGFERTKVTKDIVKTGKHY